MPYKNPEDQRRASAAHYQKHKDVYKKRSLKRNRSQRKWNKEFIFRVKDMYSCVDCGESDPIVLDFDHVVGDKIANVSDMVNQSYSIDTIKQEIRKCEVRCSNCHRKRTHERRNA